VEELEKRLENCSTATAQKQLQLDTLQQALDKLKRQVGRDEHIRFGFVGRKGRTYSLQLDTMQQALEKLKRQVGRDEHIRFSFVCRKGRTDSLQLDTLQQALEKLKRQEDRVGTTGVPTPPSPPLLYA
jgi:hypothetical protein